MSYLTFNGTPSYQYGIAISGEGTYNAPRRDTTSVTIPGRNGAYIVDNGRWENISVKYPAFVVGDFQLYEAAIREWLLTPAGYQRLEDTYHPDEFRLGRFSGAVDFKPTAWNHHAAIDLVFDCMPQRFLKSGETPVTMASGDSITNPTEFPAKPLIEISGSGSGSFSIGGATVSLTGITAQGVILDCETMDAYTPAGVLVNNKMTGDFPALEGTATLTFSGGITGVTITPRWWRL